MWVYLDDDESGLIQAAVVLAYHAQPGRCDALLTKLNNGATAFEGECALCNGYEYIIHDCPNLEQDDDDD